MSSLPLPCQQLAAGINQLYSGMHQPPSPAILCVCPHHQQNPALKPLCIYHRHQRAWDGPPVGITIPNNLKLAPATSSNRRLRLLDAFTSPQHNLLVLFAGRWAFVATVRCQVKPVQQNRVNPLLLLLSFLPLRLSPCCVLLRSCS